MFKFVFHPRLLILLLMIYCISCKPERDTVDPVILLKGNNPYNIDSIGGTFSEPGFTAVDETDGDITDKVTVQYPTIDHDTAKTYQAVYTVRDNAGNVFTTYRTINVRNTVAFLTGTFIHDTLRCSTDTADVVFQSTITQSDTINGDFFIGNFANKGSGAILRGHWDNGNVLYSTPVSLNDSDTSVVQGITGGLVLLNPTRFEIEFLMTVGTNPNPLQCKVKLYP